MAELTVGDVLMPLAGNAGLMAIVVVLYTHLSAHAFRTAAMRKIALGLALGTAALVSMRLTVEVMPGVYVDSRTVLLALAGPFGGVVAALLAGGMAAAYRVWLGGAGMPAGIATIIAPALIGLAWEHRLRWRDEFRFRDLVELGLTTAILAAALIALLLPAEFSAMQRGAVAGVVGLACALGIPALGSLLLEETRRVRLEKALRESRDQYRRLAERAESVSNAKSSFLANMSHELRTPLNAVIGFSSLIRDQTFGPVGNRRYVEYAADIHASGEHLLGLINGVLDLAQIEAGRLLLSDEEIDLHEAVAACTRMLAPRARQGKVFVRATLPEYLPHLRADPRRVKQILINLLSNAIKFTPAGGRVTVWAEVDETGVLSISVADTGIGIAPDELPKVMEAFGRAAYSLKAGVEGTGLGLPLTKRLLDLHGGTLTLDSRAGEGTKAVALFPADRVIAADAFRTTA